jgi:hypothetical protein
VVKEKHEMLVRAGRAEILVRQEMFVKAVRPEVAK